MFIIIPLILAVFVLIVAIIALYALLAKGIEKAGNYLEELDEHVKSEEDIIDKMNKNE